MEIYDPAAYSNEATSIRNLCGRALKRVGEAAISSMAATIEAVVDPAGILNHVDSRGETAHQ